MWVKKQKLEPCMGQLIDSGLRKEYNRAITLFNLYAEHILRNAGLDDLQVEIKIGRRNINNLRYAGDSTLMAESKEELKNLLMRVKEESEKVSLNLNAKKN